MVKDKAKTTLEIEPGVKNGVGEGKKTGNRH